MAKVAIIGAGFAGHTAAMYLGDAIGRDHDVTMINMSERFLYVPSLIWVGIGRMDANATRFSLKPVYDKLNVNFVHGKATEVHPDPEDQYVIAEKRDRSGETVRVNYDYLIIATGPKLAFEATPGLGPHIGHTWSVCTAAHAVESRDKYLEAVARMKKGEKQKLVIGTGHGGATCQGAAFEYVSNIAKDLQRHGVRDKADVVYLTNERQVGDFGVRGVQVKQRGKIFSSEEFIKAAFKEYGITPESGRAVIGVDKGVAYKDPDSWPAVYQNPNYQNIFAAGIAFAPPGPISVPYTNPDGTPLSPAPPRTGMVSGIIGRIVAKNVIDLVTKDRMTHSERMTEMAAACIASMGDSLWDGSAATILVYPVVPDFRRFPNEEGRDMFVTDMEMGLSGAWMKRMIHTTFMHKLQARIGWKLIPE